MTKAEIDTGLKEVIRELTGIKREMHELLIEAEKFKIKLDKVAKKK